MKNSNVPFGDGVEQKEKASTFGTTGLCSIKSPPTHMHSNPRRHACVPTSLDAEKAFTVSKKDKSRRRR